MEENIYKIFSISVSFIFQFLQLPHQGCLHLCIHRYVQFHINKIQFIPSNIVLPCFVCKIPDLSYSHNALKFWGIIKATLKRNILHYYKDPINVKDDWWLKNGFTWIPVTSSQLEYRIGSSSSVFLNRQTIPWQQCWHYLDSTTIIFQSSMTSRSPHHNKDLSPQMTNKHAS